VDDPIFDDSSTIQMSWYALMIAEEDKRKFEYERNMLEYMASFWNAEAVTKIRDDRNKLESSNFLDDEEFDKFVQSGDFKKHPVLDKIREKYGATNLNDNGERRSARDTKLPEDKSAIRSILNKDFIED
tara:strand:+ start:1422 stop:1808 length:387 start_codon:yes stop_codon:yes gene_type:complete